MATVISPSVFSPPNFLSFPLSRRSLELNPHPARRNLCCSGKKYSKGRAAKSDEELCDELREFIESMGLPEDHLPSMTELRDNGRKDLANIVRRRGYKAITELLLNSNRVNHFDKTSEGNKDGNHSPLDMVKSSGVILVESHLPRCEDSESSADSLHLKAVKHLQTRELDTVEGNYISLPTPADFPFWRRRTGDKTTRRRRHRARVYERGRGVAIKTLGEGCAFNRDFPSEAVEGDNLNDINRLKSLMCQKEMELSQLKKEIEDEKAQTEMDSWPYQFPVSEDFQKSEQRGSVIGRLLVQDKYINDDYVYANAAVVGPSSRCLARRCLARRCLLSPVAACLALKCRW